MRRCKVVPGRWKTKVVLLDGSIIVIFVPVTSRLPVVLEFDIQGEFALSIAVVREWQEAGELGW